MGSGQGQVLVTSPDEYLQVQLGYRGVLMHGAYSNDRVLVHVTDFSGDAHKCVGMGANLSLQSERDVVFNGRNGRSILYVNNRTAGQSCSTDAHEQLHCA
ncbi:hypothetical protein PHLCEN_2v4276 [Hermanssonia centrifuga]|uniref:Uncharacterized protein n=1 Tax=Hermanssonia centrifuga TaxID=98765 RepID=A0A2R6PVP3_9APHY|nr:hypothetical protein PHLCEN_2v4276 [Hermanssonia centrifuga]